MIPAMRNHFLAIMSAKCFDIICKIFAKYFIDFSNYSYRRLSKCCSFTQAERIFFKFLELIWIDTYIEYTQNTPFHDQTLKVDLYTVSIYTSEKTPCNEFGFKTGMKWLLRYVFRHFRYHTHMCSKWWLWLIIICK